MNIIGMEVFMTKLHLFIVVLSILMNSVDGQYTVYVLQYIFIGNSSSQSGLDHIALEK